MGLRICFTNFWAGAFSGANTALFLPYVFGEAFGELELVEDPAAAEVVVSSLFGKSTLMRREADAAAPLKPRLAGTAR